MANVPYFIRTECVILYVNCCDLQLSEIEALDEKIRHVGIYHNHAGFIEDEIREDISSYFAEEHVELSQNGSSLLLSKMPVKTGGQFQYAMARFDDVILYAFTVSEHDMLLISTDSTANSDLVISRILDFLKH